jgi:hypothetical protein
VHSTIEFSPFEIVYGFNPLTPMDLIHLPVDEKVSLDGNRKAQVVKQQVYALLILGQGKGKHIKS